MTMFAAFRAAAARARTAAPRMNMGGHAGGHGGGIHFHVSPIHQHTGTALGTLMWLWVMYRAKEDGAVVLGLVHPWDNHAHEEDLSGWTFAKEEVGGRPMLEGAPEDHHESH